LFLAGNAATHRSAKTKSFARSDASGALLGQLAALRLTPLHCAMVESFLSAAEGPKREAAPELVLRQNVLAS
jgi:hypothetical protein